MFAQLQECQVLVDDILSHSDNTAPTPLKATSAYNTEEELQHAVTDLGDGEHHGYTQPVDTQDGRIKLPKSLITKLEQQFDK